MTTSTEVATVEHGSALALTESDWTPNELVALSHMGVDKDVTPADLKIFRHVCERTQLDPFMKQIHMVGRNARQDDGSYVTKYTIQTGIDGFRVIGRRAASAAGDSLSIGAPEWAHHDGTWRPVWQHEWGFPVAARMTITRDGHAHTAVALWDEYKQTKRNGDVNQMWSTRRAGMLAKCAEALAWRMACPHDLAGVYTDDEMGQPENFPAPERPQSGLAAALAEPVGVSDADVLDAEVVPDEPLTDRTRKHLFVLFGKKGVAEADQLSGVNHINGTTHTSRSEITEAEAQAAIAVLKGRPDVDVAPETGDES